MAIYIQAVGGLYFTAATHLRKYHFSLSEVDGLIGPAYFSFFFYSIVPDTLKITIERLPT